jgi:hypothetical protein
MQINDRARIEALLKKEMSFDNFFIRSGIYTIKKGFFYTFGFSADKMAERIKAALGKSGLQAFIIETYDDWQPWPKDSNFVVKFTVSDK